MKKILVFINVATAIIIISFMILIALASAPIEDDIGIIGGADGPTAIWLTDPVGACVVFVLFCILLLANAYALYKK